jgi:hypothetical protein
MAVGCGASATTGSIIVRCNVHACDDDPDCETGPSCCWNSVLVHSPHSMSADHCWNSGQMMEMGQLW